MNRNRLSTLFSSLLFLLFAGTLTAADNLPALFQQGKQQFAEKSYKQSLATFDRLDKASQAPGLEGDRRKLEPAIHFYRGANLAALGREKEAVEEFKSFLAFSPNMNVDSSVYPGKVVSAFERARKEIASEKAKLPTDLANLYSNFQLPPERRVVPNAGWARSPVRYLMTSQEKAQWDALTGDSQREEFVQQFWARRDPTPGTPVNELKEEIDRRILFSEAAFGNRDSDRALVFTIMGPPNFVKVAQLHSENDPIQAMRAQALPGINPPTGRNLEMETEQGSREAWTYRKDRLPSTVPYHEVEFDFITRKGYGTDVLQRDPTPLSTLDLGAKAVEETMKAN